jgi:hypothetical protein
MDKTHESQAVLEGESCQALQKNVISEMENLGNKFSRIAEAEKNPEKAKTAFYMAIKAYELALKTEKQMKSDLKHNSRPNLELEFLASIIVSMKRSDLWRLYVDFCVGMGLTPLHKGDFFAILDKVGFKTRILSGNRVVTPPKNGVKLLGKSKT